MEITYVSEAFIQVEIWRHAGDGSIGKIRAVNQANAIHRPEHNHKAAINFADNLALFMAGQLAVVATRRLPLGGVFNVLGHRVGDGGFLVDFGSHDERAVKRFPLLVRFVGCGSSDNSVFNG